MIRNGAGDPPPSGLWLKNEGIVVVPRLNLGGSIEPIYNAVSIVEAAADKGAKLILLPVTTRKQLVELDDELATKVTIVFYSDARDALLKALVD